jgi:hypothetical protein
MRLSERTAVLHRTLRSSLASIGVHDYSRLVFRTFSNSPFSNAASREIAVAARFGKIHISAHENG